MYIPVLVVVIEIVTRVRVFRSRVFQHAPPGSHI